MNKKVYYASGVFWTNYNMDKPSRAYLEKLRWTELQQLEAIKLDTEGGKATIVSSFGSAVNSLFQAVMIDDIIWLVTETVRLPNDYYKHYIEIDIGTTYILKWLPSTGNVHIMRSHLPALRALELEDEKVNELPITYDPPIIIYPDKGNKTGSRFTIDYEAGMYHREKPDAKKYIACRGTVSVYSGDSTSAKSSDYGDVYFVFDRKAKFNAPYDREITFDIEQFSHAAGQPAFSADFVTSMYAAVPVMQGANVVLKDIYGKDDGVVSLSQNKYYYLQDIAMNVTASEMFIGVFKGPPIRYKVSAKMPPRQYDCEWLLNKGASAGMSVNGMMGALAGADVFARFKPPAMDPDSLDRFSKVYLGPEEWLPYKYGGGDDIQVLFGGAGFVGFQANTKNPDLIAPIEFGNYLPAATSTYSAYIGANKSTQNAGVKNAGALAAFSAAAFMKPKLGLGGNKLVAGINAMGAVIAGKSVQARRDDMKRIDRQIFATTDVTDVIDTRIKDGNLFLKPADHNFSYRYAKIVPDAKSAVMIATVREMFGFPCIGTVSGDLLEAYDGGYVEIDTDLLAAKLAFSGIRHNVQLKIIETLEKGFRLGNNNFKEVDNAPKLLT